MLRVDALGVRFGSVMAVRDLTVKIPAQGIVALIGPNGAGKSTLLDVLSGFVRPTTGGLRDDRAQRCKPSRLRRLSARLHQVLVLPDGVSVDSYLGVASNPRKAACILAETSPAVGKGTTGDKDTWLLIHQVLESVGIAPASDQSLEHLSWGQRRVVALAAVVLAPKRLVLLDEPFAGLATRAAEALSVLLRHLAETRPVIVAEHDLDRVLPLANLVLVMVGGRLEALFRDTEVRREQVLRYFIAPESRRTA